MNSNRNITAQFRILRVTVTAVFVSKALKSLALGRYGFQFGCVCRQISNNSLTNTHHHHIHLQICWLVCRKRYLTETTSVYPEAIVFKLFRIFCMLADLNERSDVDCHVHLHASEAVQIVRQLVAALGLDYESTAERPYDYLANAADQLVQFRFDQFLELVELRPLNDCHERRQSLQEAIEDVYQVHLKDIIKKGYLMRRGYLLPTLREYWFVLQPCELHYYKSSQERELAGTIQLHADKSSARLVPSQKSDKVRRFLVTNAGDRSFELAAHDHRTRMQWLASLQLAITYSTGTMGFQRDLADRRRQQREANRQRRQHDELVRSTTIEEARETRAQLEREKVARMAAESQALQLQAVAREDSRRVAELEDMKLTLEQLLQEETQAKRDEEIVRALQARVLSEEWEKREELERLQEEQRLLLAEERRKRMEFEARQKEKEQQLKDAEQRLRELEAEKRRLDQELQVSRSKIQQSENSKERLESKLSSMDLVGAGTMRLRDDSGGHPVRRALSFVPSTRDRPFIPVRRANLTTTSTESRLIDGPNCNVDPSSTSS